MKNILLYAISILIFAAGVARADDAQPLTVAVFDFDSKDEAVKGLGPKIATLVSANLSAEPQIVTVERAELEKALGEHELGLSGSVSSDTAAKVGNLVGAKVLVTGRVFMAGDQLVIVAKIIGTETSRVYGELVQGGEKAPLTDLSASLAKKIATDITEKAGTLIAKTQSLDERIASIKKQLAGKKLPSVSVSITEQHFGQVVIDPAAQTELSMILQQCGFKLIDETSTNRPDVVITGEALSEYGMRKGNLQSCRARIEIKARDRAQNTIIAEDRQTSAAVDLAEHIAAKTALQTGADQLAERLLPKLAGPQ